MRSIRFSAVARPTPKSFHRGGFWRYLLAAQKVTYIFKCFAVRRTARAAASRQRRPAIVRECSHASHRRPRPEYRCLFVKQALRLRAVRRRATAADCNSPRARAALRRRRTASLRAPKSQKNTSNSKKSTQIVVRYNYLYYFWTSDPSKCDVNRIAVIVNLGNLQLGSNKRMSRRVVATPRLVSTSNALRHDGRGPLVL